MPEDTAHAEELRLARTRAAQAALDALPGVTVLPERMLSLAGNCAMTPAGSVYPSLPLTKV